MSLRGPVAGMMLEQSDRFLAEQMTIYNAKHFLKIHPVELLYYFFPKAYHGSNDPAPNLKVCRSLCPCLVINTRNSVLSNDLITKAIGLLPRFVNTAEQSIRL